MNKNQTSFIFDTFAIITLAFCLLSTIIILALNPLIGFSMILAFMVDAWFRKLCKLGALEEKNDSKYR